jgi:hypothetical protein
MLTAYARFYHKHEMNINKLNKTGSYLNLLFITSSLSIFTTAWVFVFHEEKVSTRKWLFGEYFIFTI